jgi:hypothetical protein
VSDDELPTDIRGNLYIKLDPSKIIINKEREATKEEKEVTDSFMREARRRLWEAYIEKMTDNVKSNQFVVYGHANRRVVDFYSFIKRSQERIYILTTNLNFITNEKLLCNDPEIKQSQTLLQMIGDTINNKPKNFSVRILALDPDSNYVNERAAALYRNKQTFREKLRSDLNTLKKFVESTECDASIIVRTYDAYPLQMTYFFDEYVLSSVVSFGRSSRDCTTYLHSLRDRGARETFESHFENLWGNSTAYATNLLVRERRSHISDL